MKRIVYNFLLLTFIHLIQFSFGFIVIPFHFYNDRTNTNYNLNDISGKDFLELTTNKLVSSISVGSPFKELELYITMDYKLFFIGKGYCEKKSISFYEPEKSSSYTNNSFYSYPFDDLRNMTIGNDKCTLFNDYNLKTNITLNNLQLLYGTMVNISNNIYYKDKVCGIMGFKLHLMQDSYYSKFKTLEDILKANNVTNYTTWTIEFFNDEQKKKNNDYDGFLILGAGDKNYLKNQKNIDEENIRFTYSSYISNAIEWMISFQEIYYLLSNDKKKMVKFLKSEFNFDLDYYFGTKEYFESIKNNFFETYLSQNICKIQKLKEFYLRYQFIICDKSFNKEISKFPKLNFLITSYNYTFELTYIDLFKEINNEIVFLIFYDPWSPDTFKFGKNFLKKYQFIFKYDQRTIGFMNFNQKNEDSNQGQREEENNKTKQTKIEIKQIIWIIILLVLLIGIIIGVFVGKKIWDKARKKRANELLDDYEYESTNKNIN